EGLSLVIGQLLAPKRLVVRPLHDIGVVMPYPDQCSDEMCPAHGKIKSGKVHALQLPMTTGRMSRYRARVSSKPQMMVPATESRGSFITRLRRRPRQYAGSAA